MIAVVIDERKVSPQASFWRQVKQAVDVGSRVRLYPPPRGGFNLVKNGAALLAADNDGRPIGTYPHLGAAIDAWRAKRGCARV